MKETLYPTHHKSEIQLECLHNSICERCQSNKSKHYIDEYGRTVCLDCFQSGLCTTGELLYRHERIVFNLIHTLDLKYSLSEDQFIGSQFFMSCIIEKKYGFLEAVCGAGKTEMLYQGFLNGLNSGMKICFAIPRKQIVIQIKNRLQSVFPKTIVKAIHGDSKDDDGAHIIVSTIQQLIHYYHEFDILVIDEVDAFPLEGNVMYHRFIRKAIKEDGILFLMSATKIKSLNLYLEEYSMRVCSLYRKFHNVAQDLPINKHVRGLYRKFYQGIIPKSVLTILREWIENGSRIFVFVPTIKLADVVFQALHKVFPESGKITSLTEYKEQLINQFDKNQIKILVTTSVLERGVTFSKLNVMVLYADHRIYTEEMLIQIAGRVGRKKESPSGEILFISENISEEIVRSIESINFKNRMAGF
ncbi:MAG: DEAD/DEAH box helicase family protein [Firmicutes bacterium]|nr:DEAD/DEAH box helicase family protein [Bacillota bacterium]